LPIQQVIDFKLTGIDTSTPNFPALLPGVSTQQLQQLAAQQRQQIQADVQTAAAMAALQQASSVAKPPATAPQSVIL
jgi:hypothetical protein